ncbi:MAG: M15 family metallopeptidase [Desulfatirhabdiaceae bacterium]
MKRLATSTVIILWVLLIQSAAGVVADTSNMPDGFVYLSDIDSDIAVELRYYTSDNFLGQPVNGYLAPRCILTRPTALALKKIQEELKPFGLGLKVFDAYRPQQAVDHFVAWAKDIDDTRMKQAYYPNVEKQNLFRDGYIAAKSAHSRGSTVDLTIISLLNPPHVALDMGSGFDFFGPESWPDNPNLTPAQRSHRMLLQTLMKKHGFEPYDKEWWHFRLIDEPFPATWFNFPVQ